VQYFTGARHREEQGSSDDRRDAVQPEQDSGDYAKAATSAADSPEQIRFVLIVHGSSDAVGTDDLDR
jgi:hypothetical protein